MSPQRPLSASALGAGASLVRRARRRALGLWGALVFGSTAGCRGDVLGLLSPSAEPSAADAASDAPPPWDAAELPAAPPKGMVWIPPGPLVVGTPPGVLPRIADEEMAGEQLVLSGFFISILPYPSEEGAIPVANVTQAEARAACEDRSQRLCSELEWERACKGPHNWVYEYGDRYRPEMCGTGEDARLLPAGVRVGCRSEFGVKDMHGGLWEWTESPWGRGVAGDLATVRGGNALAGELVGRCANAMGRPPSAKASTVGFRCCAGERNTAEVEVPVERGPVLVKKEPMPREVAAELERALPRDVVRSLREPATFSVSSLWAWRPIGNEELVLAGGCSGPIWRRTCGVVVARMGVHAPEVLGWAPSGHFQPTVRPDPEPRHVWVYGGDRATHFTRRVSYAWGRVVVGDLTRDIHPKRKRRAAPAAKRH